ncbi:MAG: zinc ABC transporter substrate-binding protein [Chloroflexi bacterium]|nr:zinc ABC transporter substrate-binding protein [Chloroflexota bacterium]
MYNPRTSTIADRFMRGYLLIPLLLAIVFGGLACTRVQATENRSGKTIVVTYPILGSVVKDLVGNEAAVIVPMPNGQDPHEWEPSAKDIATLNKADLVVQNGLGLEGGMEKTLKQAEKAGVKLFTASDHIQVRKVGSGEGIPSGDPDQAEGADDSHIWTDPSVMKAVAMALAARLETDLAIDVSDRLQDLTHRLDALDKEVAAAVATVPQTNRKLVTGHESMGYFAQRYGFKLVGAIIPSQTSQAEVSASDLAELKTLIQENKVKVVFTELGTSPAVAQAIGRESGAKVVELSTHVLDKDGSYFTFLRNLAKAIVDGLR